MGQILKTREQEDIARLIIEQEADFVQLNEFYLNNCMVIDSLLRMHYPYKEDEWAKVKAGDVFYSKRPLVETGKVKGMYNTIYSKMCLKKDSLYIIGCHLASNNHERQIVLDNIDLVPKIKAFWKHYRKAQEKRKKHAHLLKEVIRESSLPMIVMGDMNDFNHSAPMDSLKDAGMKNAWWEGGFGYGATYHEGWLRLRIDISIIATS